jgi:hypothetical protein
VRELLPNQRLTAAAKDGYFCRVDLMKAINANFARLQTLGRAVWLCCVMPKHGICGDGGRIR